MDNHNYYLRDRRRGGQDIRFNPQGNRLSEEHEIPDSSRHDIHVNPRERGIYSTPGPRGRHLSPRNLAGMVPMSEPAADPQGSSSQRYRQQYHDRLNLERISARIANQNMLNPRGQHLHGDISYSRENHRDAGAGEPQGAPPLMNFRVEPPNGDQRNPSRYINSRTRETTEHDRLLNIDFTVPPPEYQEEGISERLLEENHHRDRHPDAPRQSTLQSMSPVCLNDTEAVGNLGRYRNVVQHDGEPGRDIYNAGNEGLFRLRQRDESPRYRADTDNRQRQRDESPRYRADINIRQRQRDESPRYRAGNSRDRADPDIRNRHPRVDPNDINLDSLAIGGQDMQRVVNVKEPTLPTFSGIAEEFKDFKELFLAITSGYSSRLRVLLLKQQLDKKSRNYVVHIDASEANAEELMWSELNKTYNHNKTRATYHLSKLFAATRWPKCTCKNDLEELFIHLRYHYTSLCKEGAQYVEQAEMIKNFISPALYGKSFDKLTWLVARGTEYNMERVLFILEEHIHFERSREVALGQVNLQDQPNSSKFKNYNRSGDYNNSNREYNNHNNRKNYSSRDDSRSRSPSASNSKDYSNNYNNRKSYGSRDDSRSRSPLAFKDDFRSRNKDRSASPHKAHAFMTSSETTQGKDNIVRDRSRSRSPGSRGERSYSPGPNRDMDRYKYKCHVCKSNGHSVVDCKVKSSEEMLSLARVNGLCFKCFVRGHTSLVCPLGKECKTPECKQLMSHHEHLCKALKGARYT